MPYRMIQIEPLSDERWLVTVSGSGTTTQHRVRVSSADVERYGSPTCSSEQLLEASFRFLLHRESNTAILSEFELPLISRYFPEYEREIRRYLDE